jgi:oxygen-independent coproporphyrinogen-3 oxidase
MTRTTELALYLHIPFCRRRCDYCSFISYAGRELETPAYVGALATEMRLRREPDTIVKSIYFGGGTPSLLSASQIYELLNVIHDHYPVHGDAEITLEANPGTINTGYLKSIRSSGVNRLSLGIQSLDDAELQFLGRIHTADEGKQSVKQSREAGFDNLSLDFIYGIPGRYKDDWQRMLDEIVRFKASHLSLYALTLEENTALAVKVKRGEVQAPDDDTAALEYEMACELLQSGGYGQYEISNWSLPGAESRHNLVYWQRQPYLGLGVAAHSLLGIERSANTSDIDLYLTALADNRLPERTVEIINDRVALAETLILGLRLNQGITADDIEMRFGVDLYCHFASEIAELTALGLLENAGEWLRLTARGRLLGNEAFLRFLPS